MADKAIDKQVGGNHYKSVAIQSVKVLRKSLKDDKEYYVGWQANIAMACVDALSAEGIEGPLVHKCCTEGAKRFLDTLIGDVD